MQSRKCPQCNLVNFPNAQSCKRCNADLSQSLIESVIHENESLFEEQPFKHSEAVISIPIPSPVVYSENKANVGDAISGLLWLLMIPVMAFAGLDLMAGLKSANSAPQQAAAAAMSLGYAVIPYCFARAVSECIKSFQGR